MTDHLRAGHDRWRSQRDARAAKEAAELGASAEASRALQAHIDVRVEDGLEMITRFLSLMARNGSPGLKRWKDKRKPGRTNKTLTHMVREESRYLGFLAWADMSYLTPDGRFDPLTPWRARQYQAPIDARTYLRNLLASSFRGRDEPRVPPTKEKVDSRLQTFGHRLGEVLAIHGVSIPD